MKKILLLITMLVMFASFVNAVIPTENIEACISFDDSATSGSTVIDSSGQHDGTKTSGVSSGRNGFVNEAYGWDGTDPEGVTLNATLSQDISMTVCLIFNGTDTSSYNVLFDQGNAGAGGALGMALFLLGGNVAARYGDDAANQKWGNIDFAATNDVTYMACANYADGANITLWVDGVLRATDTSSQAGGSAPPYENARIGDAAKDAQSGLSYRGDLIDEIMYFNKSLSAAEIVEIYNSGSYTSCVELFAPPIPPSVPGLPIITLNTPENDTAENTLEIPFTFTPLFNASKPEGGNCSLYTNSTGIWRLNKTNTSIIVNNTQNIINLTLTEGNYLWNVQCFDNNSNSSFAFNNFTLTIDTTSPVVVTNFVNDTRAFSKNLTGQFNFSDNNLIFSVNFTLPNQSDQIVFAQNGIDSKTFQVDLSFDPSNLTPGDQILRLRFADAHTRKTLKDKDAWNPTNGLFNNYLKYQIKAPYQPLDLKISIEGGSLFDAWTYKFNQDRYSEIVKPANPGSEQVFLIESTQPIHIIEYPGMYGGKWLIIDEHWKDFVLKEEPGAVIEYITLIDKYTARVKITNITNNINRLEFESTGDLNIVTIDYTFFIVNVTETFIDPAINRFSTNFFLKVDNLNDSFDVIFQWKNQNFTPTIFSQDATSIIFNKTITPNESLNISNFSVDIFHKWYINLSGLPNDETNLTAQNVTDVGLDNCTLYSTIALNYSIKDETNSSLTPVDIDGVYSYQFSTAPPQSFTLNEDNQSNFQICISPQFVNMTGNYSLEYSFTTYPERRFIDNAALYDNITQNIDLWVLNVNDGLFVRFRTVTTTGQTISQVRVVAQTIIDSVVEIVEVENTDDSGIATFFVNPDTDYIFTFSKSGFATQSFTLRPTTAEILTVVMISTVSDVVQPDSIGLSWNFIPQNNVLNNDTVTNFTFNLNSTFRDITNCTFFLKNGSTIISSKTGTFTIRRCNATISLDSNSFEIITANAEYTLNLTINRSISKDYRVIHTFQGNFSLMNFFDDLSAFNSSGFNDLTRMMLALIVIITIISLVSIKSPALRDPEPLLIFTWALVWMFSFVGWFTINSTTIPTIAFFDLQQYIFFIVVTLVAASYIIQREFR